MWHVNVIAKNDSTGLCLLQSSIGLQITSRPKDFSLKLGDYAHWPLHLSFFRPIRRNLFSARIISLGSFSPTLRNKALYCVVCDHNNENRTIDSLDSRKSWVSMGWVREQAEASGSFEQQELQL